MTCFEPECDGTEFISATYSLKGTLDEARAMAHDICIEQTVEFPEDLVVWEDIRENIFGRVVSFETVSADLHTAVIDFPVETAGNELTQLVNLLFGNISIKPGIRLTGFELPPSLQEKFNGPAFGIDGMRRLLDAHERPLLATALKPMGLSPTELADFAYQFALGGMDIIKDDHGLADQAFCPFEQRITECSRAVQGANSRTGRKCLYFPNITAPFDLIESRARFARDAGAGGFVISCGLSGLDTMRFLADSGEYDMPIMSHPALQGQFTVCSDHGIAPGVLWGKLNRLSGADACIFPNYGGRFTLTKEDCAGIMRACSSEMGHFRPILPVPAGGMTLDKVSELVDFYGKDVVLLIGGDLHRHGPNLIQNCRKFFSIL